MEQTFITIHNLEPDANILYASDSIVDILGYAPQHVLGRSSFDYFHPAEVPFARSTYSNGVHLDKAAVLKYCRIRANNGQWVGCECCFTVVHDVLFACTSVYRCGVKSEKRALDAPEIRRIFSCSPRDPRYHMLEHLSAKFTTVPRGHEPRAALILNRFTRSLSVMYATEAVSLILGVAADQVVHKSFYECIRESCLDDALGCIESAKANDSIAYLRFWSRDPRRPEDFEDDDQVSDIDVEQNDSEGHNQDTEMSLRGDSGRNPESLSPADAQRLGSRRSSDSDGGARLDAGEGWLPPNSRSPSIKVEAEADVEMADAAPNFSSSSSEQRLPPHPPVGMDSLGSSSGESGPRPAARLDSQRSRRQPVSSVELEAVISCTSDGLVVILRRARPQAPDVNPPVPDKGIFAAPWGQRPMQPSSHTDAMRTRPQPLGPQPVPEGVSVASRGEPRVDHQLMTSIREVAVFAWALVGINGNLASYSRGAPVGEAQPPDGLPVWDPSASPSLSYLGPENQAVQRWANYPEPSDTLPWQNETPSNQHGASFARNNGLPATESWGRQVQYGAAPPQSLLPSYTQSSDHAMTGTQQDMRNESEADVLAGGLRQHGDPAGRQEDAGHGSGDVDTS